LQQIYTTNGVRNFIRIARVLKQHLVSFFWAHCIITNIGVHYGLTVAQVLIDWSELGRPSSCNA